ncbi:MAG TPA: hypothetical protein VFB80_18520 [Pirellulaceae bacterium]|nr:hypothetical protein [Pirellulaceae bacterium]
MRTLTRALVLVVATVTAPLAARGQDFRVDTELFVGTEKTPALETLTIFTDGLVYDFVLTEPREVVILDTQRGRFSLLDESRQVRASMATQDLLDFTLALESHAATGKNALLAFAARPKFQTAEKTVDENGQSLLELRLSGKPIEYVVLGARSERPEAAKIYRHFADWYARLNATRPGNLPAGARLAVNEELGRRELLPREVTRIITPANPLARKLEVKTRHLVNWTLSGEDRRRIERAGDWLATYRPISYDEYRGANRQPPAQQAKR